MGKKAIAGDVSIGGVNVSHLRGVKLNKILTVNCPTWDNLLSYFCERIKEKGNYEEVGFSRRRILDSWSSNWSECSDCL